VTLPQFYTIGVYNNSFDSFFGKIKGQKIDTFLDIRRRRAVRGSKYAFVNSTRLQEVLTEMEIKYHHIIELAPTNDIRLKQKIADKYEGVNKSSRSCLSSAFIHEYSENILAKYDFDSLIRKLDTMGTKRAVLFCVEEEANACHRSLVAEEISTVYGSKVIDL
jgi:uncharacterized protein (DUF488 family)